MVLCVYFIPASTIYHPWIDPGCTTVKYCGQYFALVNGTQHYTLCCTVYCEGICAITIRYVFGLLQNFVLRALAVLHIRMTMKLV